MSKFLFSFLFIPALLFSISDEEFFRIQQAQRQIEVNAIKSEVCRFDIQKPVLDQENNGDESLYQDLHGNFNKGLSHQQSGFPNVEAYRSLVKALTSRNNSLFNEILIGEGDYKLVNPQASLTCTLTGNDAWINAIEPAPAFNSQESAGEMIEVYWTALVRDLPFNEFLSNTTVDMAVDELNSIPVFKGPKVNGLVTGGTFLRGNVPGALIGPYISQFLYQEIPFGARMISAEQEVPLPGKDFNTSFSDWFTTITGGTTGETIDPNSTLHFIRTARDLTEYVHRDTPGQGALGALLILESYLAQYGNEVLDRNNPYINNPTQDAFVTFGIGDILNLVRVATQTALEAAWFQKWQVNRRLRPEEYGFYVQKQKVENIDLGIPSSLIDSVALFEIEAKYGSYFLPQAYPEGSPVHPSYPAGHSTFMGAAVTILKAFYNEGFVIPNPLEPDVTNTNLVSFTGGDLTVGGELNKLAANIALGRDHAGVHYRSDGYQGLLLGEMVAIDVLNNQAFLFNEDFKGFSLTKFDGSRITIGGKK